MEATAVHTVALPIYVSTQRHDEVVAAPAVSMRWEEICHGQRGRRFVWIRHLAFRNTGSGRGATPRLRPWVVGVYSVGRLFSHREASSATLAGAIKLAKRIARDG
jgi:hypothetical protein